MLYLVDPAVRDGHAGVTLGVLSKCGFARHAVHRIRCRGEGEAEEKSLP